MAGLKETLIEVSLSLGPGVDTSLKQGPCPPVDRQVVREETSQGIAQNEGSRVVKAHLRAAAPTAQHVMLQLSVAGAVRQLEQSVSTVSRCCWWYSEGPQSASQETIPSLLRLVICIQQALIRISIRRQSLTLRL
jgi:hypothetical protein